MDEKNAYRQKLEARLDQWRAEIDKLEARTVEASADARLKYKGEIKELRAKQDEAREKLDELGDAQGQAWNDLKSGLEVAWDELGKAVRNATGRFD